MKSPRIYLVSVFAIFLACAFLVGCGGGSSSTPPNTITSSGNNVAAISVDGGPVGNYADAAFTSVTVCVPGTSTCQTISGILVDTGSSGLRILASALSIALPQQNASDGNPVVECFPFVSGYTWGPVQTADVEMAGEKASSTPIQVLSSNFTVPSGCTSQGTSSNSDLDANGIVGVGLFTQDCGDYCTVVQTGGNPNLYYECSSSTVCQPVAESLAQQVPNPVSLFSTDNNGVIIELPKVSTGGEPSVGGSLVFGIGTQSNNALSGATIYTADDFGNFTTTYSGTAYPDSFIDSGSNGYYFLDQSLTGITECGGDELGFYCPAGTVNISATNQGQNGSSGTISVSIENADTLFNSNDSAYSDLGGVSGTSAPYYFDLGLPFFFGRNLYTGLQSATYANGYWAY